MGGRSELTLFEYLAAGYVLMLSFAVLRALSGVPHAARSPSRYWVHLSWLSTALASCLVGFWAFWFYREVEWTFFQFIGALAPPALLYTYVSLLVRGGGSFPIPLRLQAAWMYLIQTQQAEKAVQKLL